MTDAPEPNGASAVATRLIAEDQAANGTDGRYAKAVEGRFGPPAALAKITAAVLVGIGVIIGGLALGNVGPFAANAPETASGVHTADTTTTTTSTVPAAVGQFGLGLSNFTVELMFTGLSFTSCPSDLQTQIPPTFSGGWEFTTDPGSTGKPVNVTLSPLPSSPFGDFMDGTISSKGVLTATGDGPYDRLSLTLMLPSALSAGKATTPTDVTGSATVQSHFGSTGECTERWSTVTGAASPP